MADRLENQVPSIGWCVFLMGTSVAAGFSSLCLAFCGSHRAAVIAATLSIVWSAMAAVLLALRSSPQRMRAQLNNRIVEQAMCSLVQELKDRSNGDRKGNPSRAEMVDRLHGTVLKVLDESNRTS